MSMVSPGITTVDQRTDDLGRTCARLVVDRIAGTAAGQATVRYIEPSVTLRGSTASPRGAAVPAARPEHGKRHGLPAELTARIHRSEFPLLTPPAGRK
jgi:hypothetical protein